MSLALVRGRVTGAGFQPDGKIHFRNRSLQVAGNIDRKCLQRRDVKCVDAIARGTGFSFALCFQFHQAWQEPGQGLPGARRRNQQRGMALLQMIDQLQLMGPWSPSPRGKPALESVW